MCYMMVDCEDPEVATCKHTYPREACARQVKNLRMLFIPFSVFVLMYTTVAVVITVIHTEAKTRHLSGSCLEV